MSLKTLTVAATLAAAIALPALPAEAEEHLYWGATLLDPVTERATPNSWIIVDGGKITRTGKGRAPRDIPAERRHDFRGHFLLPGLFDTHAHIALGPLAVKAADGAPRLEVAYDPAIVEHNGRLLLAYGVTTIRDTGEATEHGTAYARDERAGRILGPEALMAGDIIDRSPMDFVGLLANLPGAGPIDAIVRRQKEAGVDYIKLYAHLSEADLAEGITAARAAGLKSVGHLESVSWTRAAELGIDAITHMMPTNPDLLPPDKREAYRTTTRGGAFTFFEWFELVDLEGPEIATMIRTLKEKGVHVDATLIVFYLNFYGDHDAIRDADLALAPAPLVANWKAGFRFDLGWKPEDYRRAQAVWPKVLKLTRMLHEAGVPMTLGTDMANPFTAPGRQPQPRDGAAPPGRHPRLGRAAHGHLGRRPHPGHGRAHRADRAGLRGRRGVPEGRPPQGHGRHAPGRGGAERRGVAGSGDAEARRPG